MNRRALSSAALLSLAPLALAQQPTVESARAAGLGPYLAFCFGGGLLSLLTPCVFPMVPVTVSYFSKQSGNAVPKALSYAFGIIGTFTFLGIGASLLFGATGIARFATNPWVNLVLGLVFVALALNLFGVFEIQPPAWLANKTGKQGSKGGLLGPFFMGMTFSMTSFTCTAPIAGSLLAAAAKGDYFYPAVGMATYGLAFAAPFFLLALFPSSLSKMPKSGEWMNVVKPALAFVELAAAVKFFSNADLGFELGWITRPVFLAAWIVIFVGMAAFLLGFLTKAKSIGTVRRGFGVASLAFAALLVMGMTGQSMGVINSFPPPDPYPTKTGSIAKKVDVKPDVKGRIEAPNYKEAIRLAKETGRTIFVDFTGVNCINCRLMEKNIFPKPDVKAELDKMVYVQLYTDRPNAEDEANKKLQDDLAKNIALPTYVLVKPDGSVIDKFEGLSPTPEEFVKFLQKATT